MNNVSGYLNFTSSLTGEKTINIEYNNLSSLLQPVNLGIINTTLTVNFNNNRGNTGLTKPFSNFNKNLSDSNITINASNNSFTNLTGDNLLDTITPSSSIKYNPDKYDELYTDTNNGDDLNDGLTSGSSLNSFKKTLEKKNNLPIVLVSSSQTIMQTDSVYDNKNFVLELKDGRYFFVNYDKNVYVSDDMITSSKVGITKFKYDNISPIQDSLGNIYLIGGNSSSGNQVNIEVSNDLGVTWKHIYTFTPDNGNFQYTKSVITDDDVIIVANNNGVYYSTDYAKSFIHSNQQSYRRIGNILYDKNNNIHYFATLSNFKSTQQNNGYDGIFTDFEFEGRYYPKISGIKALSKKSLFGVTNSNEFVYSKDGGNSWYKSNDLNSQYGVTLPTPGGNSNILINLVSSKSIQLTFFTSGQKIKVDIELKWPIIEDIFNRININSNGLLSLTNNDNFKKGAYEEGYIWNAFNKQDFTDSTYIVMMLNNGDLLRFINDTGDSTDKIMKSTDGGDTWSIISTSSPVNTRPSFSKQMDDGTIILGGGNSDEMKSKLFLSTDGGVNWSNKSTNYTLTSHVYCLTDGDEIHLMFNRNQYWSDDKGDTWNYRSMNVEPYDFTQTSKYFIGVRSEGYVYRSSDKGASWDRVSNHNGQPRQIIAVNDILLLFYYQEYGKYSYSLDHGATWETGKGQIKNTSVQGSFLNLTYLTAERYWVAGQKILIENGNKYHIIKFNFTTMNINNKSYLNVKGTSDIEINDQLIIDDCKYITFDGITFNDNLSNTRDYAAIRCSNNTNIVFKNCTFNINRYGLLADNDILIENCIFNLKDNPGTDCVYLILESFEKDVGFKSNTFENHNNVKHNILFTDAFEEKNYDIISVNKSYNNFDTLLKFIEAPNGDILLISKYNIYISKDKGLTWSYNNFFKYKGIELRNFLGHPTNLDWKKSSYDVLYDINGSIHLGLDNAYVATSIDNGESWDIYESNVTIDNRELILQRNDGNIYRIDNLNKLEKVKKVNNRITGYDRNGDINVSMNDGSTTPSVAEYVLKVVKKPDGKLVIFDRNNAKLYETTDDKWTTLKYIQPLSSDVTGNYTMKVYNNIIYLFSDYLYKSSDWGRTWTSKNLPADSYYKNIVKKSDSQDIFLKLSEDTLITYDFTNGTKTTENFVDKFDTTAKQLFNKGDSDIFYVGDDIILHDKGTFYKSIDDGKTWNLRNTLSEDVGDHIYIMPDNTWVFLGNDLTDVYHSTDDGLTVTLVGTNVGDVNGTNMFSGTLVFIVSGDNIYAITDSNGIYKSTDKGINWTQTTSGNIDTLTNIATIHDVFAFGLDDTSFILNGTYGRTFKTTDSGVSFIELDKRIDLADRFSYNLFRKSDDGYYYHILLTDKVINIYKSTTGEEWELHLSSNKMIQGLKDFDYGNYPNNCIKTKDEGFLINLDSIGLYKLRYGNIVNDNAKISIYQNSFVPASSVIKFNYIRDFKRKIFLVIKSNNGNIENSKFFSLTENTLNNFSEILIEDNNITNSLNGLLSIERKTSGDLTVPKDNMVKIISNTNSTATGLDYTAIESSGVITKKNINNDISNLVQKLNETKKQQFINGLDHPVEAYVALDQNKGSDINISFSGDLEYNEGESLGNSFTNKRKFAVNTGYSGVVSKLNINVLDDQGNKITDFTDKPLIVRLNLPHAPSTANLKLYKTNGNGIKLDPQPEHFPAQLSYQSATGLWKGELKSLSEHLVEDDSTDGSSGGDPHVKNIYGKKITLSNEWKYIKLYQKNNIKVIGEADFLDKETLKYLYDYINNKEVKIDTNKKSWVTDYTYFINLYVLQDNKIITKMDLIEGKILKSNDIVKIEKCNTKGLNSLTHNIIYPKRKHKAFNIILPTNDYITVNIDTHWGDINSIDLTLGNNDLSEYQGELFAHNEKLNRLFKLIV